MTWDSLFFHHEKSLSAGGQSAQREIRDAGWRECFEITTITLRKTSTAWSSIERLTRILWVSESNTNRSIHRLDRKTHRQSSGASCTTFKLMISPIWATRSRPPLISSTWKDTTTVRDIHPFSSLISNGNFQSWTRLDAGGNLGRFGPRPSSSSAMVECWQLRARRAASSSFLVRHYLAQPL